MDAMYQRLYPVVSLYSKIYLIDNRGNKNGKQWRRIYRDIRCEWLSLSWNHKISRDLIDTWQKSCLHLSNGNLFFSVERWNLDVYSYYSINDVWQDIVIKQSTKVTQFVTLLVIVRYTILMPYRSFKLLQFPWRSGDRLDITTPDLNSSPQGHVRTHFLEWKYLNFIWSFIETYALS